MKTQYNCIQNSIGQFTKTSFHGLSQVKPGVVKGSDKMFHKNVSQADFLVKHVSQDFVSRETFSQKIWLWQKYEQNHLCFVKPSQTR